MNDKAPQRKVNIVEYKQTYYSIYSKHFRIPQRFNHSLPFSYNEITVFINTSQVKIKSLLFFYFAGSISRRYHSNRADRRRHSRHRHPRHLVTWWQQRPRQGRSRIGASHAEVTQATTAPRNVREASEVSGSQTDVSLVQKEQ